MEGVFCDDAGVDKLTVAEALVDVILLQREGTYFCLPVVAFQFPQVFLADALIFALNGGCSTSLAFP